MPLLLLSAPTLNWRTYSPTLHLPYFARTLLYYSFTTLQARLPTLASPQQVLCAAWRTEHIRALLSRRAGCGRQGMN